MKRGKWGQSPFTPFQELVIRVNRRFERAGVKALLLSLVFPNARRNLTMLRSFNVGVIALLVGLLVTTGCSNSTPEDSRGGQSNPTASNNSASLNKDDYPVFPDPDAGADPAVPAEQGGRGFTGEGWETNTNYDLIGDPRAVKGGVFRQAMTINDFPTTLRYYGPNVSAWNAWLSTIVYETLLGLHPTTLDYTPGLATHWQISEDKKSFRFRINPNARWSDGNPVVSDDVIASWKLTVDKGLQDPGLSLIFQKFEQPIAESKYIVSVRAKTENWRNFLEFSNSLFIFPAHVLKNLNGDAYIREWNYKMLPGSGPYMISEPDIQKGKMITVRRRKDYWAANERRNVGTANFDELQEITVRDRNLEFEMFKKGDLDFYNVNRASMWVQELNYDNIKRGLNQKRKIFNHNPNGIQGMAMNTRREPLNDVRVRKALRHLFNREQMIEKLIFNEYVPMDSRFPGSIYENPKNEKVKYDPRTAVQLLAEAGWRDRDSAGRLVKNGRPFSLELIYADQATERYATIFQEDLRKVGITLNLRLVTFETMIKLLDERTFDMVSSAYTGMTFPDIENMHLSRLADEKNTNNITGFKNQRADEIIAAYNKSFDQNERVKLLQEFDGIFTSEHHWILEWTAPYQRIVYWNKFGQPQGIISNVGDYHDPPAYWWIDSEKSQRLQAALKDSSMQLGGGPSDDRYWLEYSKSREGISPVTK
jgi:microcin C transport system substrate-binding protein